MLLAASGRTLLRAGAADDGVTPDSSASVSTPPCTISGCVCAEIANRGAPLSGSCGWSPLSIARCRASSHDRISSRAMVRLISSGDGRGSKVIAATAGGNDADTTTCCWEAGAAGAAAGGDDDDASGMGGIGDRLRDDIRGEVGLATGERCCCAVEPLTLAWPGEPLVLLMLLLLL